MANSARANLPLLAPNQRSKELTHNEALTMLEGITVGAVAAMNVPTPPGSPAEGLTVVVGANPTGVFVAHTNAIAHFYNNSWKFYNPQIGWLVRSIQNDFADYVFNGTNWVLAENGGDASTLAGQLPAFYLNRASHEGTQTAATISDFMPVVAAIIANTPNIAYLDRAQTFSKTQAIAPVALQSANAIAIDCSNQLFTLLLNHNATISFTNITAGMTLNLEVTQSDTGDTLNFPSNCTFPNNDRDLSIGAGRIDVITLISFDGVNFRCLIARGF